MSDLRARLEDGGLGEYADRLAREKVDLQLLARIPEASVESLCKDWPWGDRERLRQLCAHLRAEETARATKAHVDPALAPPSLVSPRRAVVASPSIVFEQEVIDHLPLVVARPLHALLAETEPDRVVRQAEQLVDLTMRFLGLVCQADYYAHAGWFDGKLNVAIDSKLRRPSLGHWIEFVREAIASARRAKVGLFLQQLPDAWEELDNTKRHANSAQQYDELGRAVQKSGKLSTLDWLASARNAFAHGRRSHDDPQAAAAFRDKAVDLLNQLRWLRQYELWVVERGSKLRLRGLEPIAESGAPPYSGESGTSIILRWRDAKTRDGGRTLDLPPLVVTEKAVKVDGRADEPALFCGLGDRDAVTYTPVRPGATAIETQGKGAEYRSSRNRKQFQRLTKSEIATGSLLERIRGATARSLAILRETGKYRQEIHCERKGCEPVLEPWIHSPKPLLAIEACAGAGKTGVLASLVERRWLPCADAPPVLFLLARELHAASIGGVLREALVLDDDVSTRDISDALRGKLVVVIDGLNEHRNRSDLIEGIVDQAKQTLDQGAGLRFVVSWREEDRRWIAGKLSQHELWWSPPKNRGMKPKSIASGASVAKVRDQDSAVQQSTIPRVDAESADWLSNLHEFIGADSAFRLPALTHVEVERMWEHYRANGSRPHFDYQALRKQDRLLAESVRNPLDMRIAVELFHDRHLPEVGPDGLYEGYLEELRSEFPESGRLLDTLAELLTDGRTSAVHQYEISERERGLVYSTGPLSALDYLDRRGVLSIRTDRNERLVGFTNERIAEQMLGQRFLRDSRSDEPEWFADRVAELTSDGFVLATGGARIALEALVTRHGAEYLFRFAARSPDVSVEIAGRVLARALERDFELAATRLVAAIEAEPTDARLSLARAATNVLCGWDRIDRAQEFLEALSETLRQNIKLSDLACELCVEYLRILWRRAEGSNGSIEARRQGLAWAKQVVMELQGHDRPHQLSRASGFLALLHLGADRHAEARACAELALRAAEASGMAARRASSHLILGLCCRVAGDIDQALRQFRLTREHIANGDNRIWVCSRELEAAVLRDQRRFDRSSTCEEEAARARVELGDLSQAAYALARAAEDRTKIARGAAAARTAFDGARLLAERSGDCDAMEYCSAALGDYLKARRDPSEAILYYQHAIDVRAEDARGEAADSGHLLHAMAECHQELQDQTAASRLFERAVGAFEASEDFADAARSALKLVTLYREAQLGCSIDWGERAVELAGRVTGPDPLAVARAELGESLQKSGRFHAAIAQYDLARESIDACEHDYWSKDLIWARTADCWEGLEDWEAALRQHIEILDFDRESGRQRDVTYQCGRISDVLWRLGRIEEGLTWHRRAVEFAERSGGDGARGAWREHLLLGDALRKAGRTEEALQSYAAAVECSALEGELSALALLGGDEIAQLIKWARVSSACTCLDTYARFLLELAREGEAVVAAHRQSELLTALGRDCPLQDSGSLIRAAGGVIRIAASTRELGMAAAAINHWAPVAEALASTPAPREWQIEACAEFWEAVVEYREKVCDTAAHSQAAATAAKLRARMQELTKPKPG